MAAVVDVEAAVLSGFLTELAVVDLTRGQVLGRLRSAAHEAGVLARRDIEQAPIPQAHLFTSCPPPPPARHPDLVLARAVAAGAITRNEVALIGSTRLEPISLAQVAVLRGQSYRDVRAARIRAERKLSTFLREQDTGSIDTFLTRTTATRSATHTQSRTGTRPGSSAPHARTRRSTSTPGQERQRSGAPDNRTSRPHSQTGAPEDGATSTTDGPALSPAHEPTSYKGIGEEAGPVASPPPGSARRHRRRRRNATRNAPRPNTIAPSAPRPLPELTEPVVPPPDAAATPAATPEGPS